MKSITALATIDFMTNVLQLTSRNIKNENHNKFHISFSLDGALFGSDNETCGRGTEKPVQMISTHIPGGELQKIEG